MWPGACGIGEGQAQQCRTSPARQRSCADIAGDEHDCFCSKKLFTRRSSLAMAAAFVRYCMAGAFAISQVQRRTKPAVTVASVHSSRSCRYGALNAPERRCVSPVGHRGNLVSRSAISAGLSSGRQAQ